jgi:hypothetical protein
MLYELAILAQVPLAGYSFAIRCIHSLLALPSRKKFTAQTHWLGWSAYLVARRRSAHDLDALVSKGG